MWTHLHVSSLTWSPKIKTCFSKRTTTIPQIMLCTTQAWIAATYDQNILRFWKQSKITFKFAADIPHIPARTLLISGLKFWVLKLPFLTQNDGEEWSRISYFEIHRAPSKIPANLPGQFSLSGQIFLHCAGQQQLWKGSLNFKITNSRPLFTIVFKSKMSISRFEILVHL